MEVPTAEQIADLSRVDFEGLDAPFAVPEELQPLVDQANSFMQLMTGRQWGTMPTVMEPIALGVSRMRTEQIAFMAQPDYVETINDDAVASFSAGSYSESRTSLAQRGITTEKALNCWPELNDSLWMLMGPPTDGAVDDAREMWLALLTGQVPPAFGVTEVDWNLDMFGMTWPRLRWSYDPMGNVVPDPYASWQTAQ